MSKPAFALGDVTIARVEDNLAPSLPTKVMFPGFREAIWRAERHWLAPTYMTADGAQLRTSIHSWVVRTPHHVVLIDSCIGNAKPRHVPYFNMRDVPWLERLGALGVAPEQVDFVLCTHLHADHVGWNTRLRDGRWVPTFPNARYLFGTAEFARWDPRRPEYRFDAFNEHVFEDSVLPVVESGQMVLVEDGHTLDDRLTVQAAPGHTPGHFKVALSAAGAAGIFCGDILHHPIQIPYPEICSSFDDDMGAALHTRLALLEDIADRDVLLMPTHFAEPHCCHVVADGARFGIRWLG
jgi:glyoxylase-like metal-dependent hydrolase (beta-lactamase superfamily II)